MAHTHIIRFTVHSVLCASLLVVAGCSTDTNTNSGNETDAVSGGSVATTTAPTVATTAPSTTSVVTSTTAATAPATEPVPDFPPSEYGPLDAGPYSATNVVAAPLSLDVDLPEAGLYAIDMPGFLTVSADPFGSVSYVTVLDAASTRVIETPLDANKFGDPAYALDRSVAMPDDLLTWLSAQPGVSADPIESVEFGGVPARRLSATIGAFDGGLGCVPVDSRACHFLFHQPATGVSLFQFVGDKVTVFEVPLGDTRLIVVVDLNADPELATTVADSLRFGE